MAKRKLTPEQEKEIKLLRANNEMYEKTKEEAKLRGTPQAVKRIEIAQEEVQNKIKSIENGALENFEIPQEEIKPVVIEHKPIVEENNDFDMKSLLTNEQPEQDFNNEPKRTDESIYSVIEKHKRKEKAAKEQKIKNKYDIVDEEDGLSYGEEIVNPSKTTFNNVDSTAQYDVISLPSNGECYKNKIGRLPVAYLTAYDENIITSPNLYRDGLVIDYLLKNKIVNKNINVDELVSGDVDAIMLFLRATSYGTDYPIVVEDPDTGERIESVIDLSKIKTKEFKLKGDENGYFSYTLPKTKYEVKFKYLTRKEENDLRLLTRIENEGTVSTDLNFVARSLRNILKNDSILNSKESAVMLESIRKIENWARKAEEENDNKYHKAITNRLEMQIMSINGIEDKDEIRKLIYNMPANDSLKLRRYILDNEPGLDFEIEVERPESLGGGSFKTFLQWDDTIFLNIS